MRGNKLDVLSETSSGVAGKHRQGGQSARRFERLREMELNDYYNRVAHVTREYFIDIYPVKGLIVSGPGPTKESIDYKTTFLQLLIALMQVQKEYVRHLPKLRMFLRIIEWLKKKSL